MSIPVSLNFDINVAAPIDSRMVATDSTARLAIQYKYAGLKVFQLDDAKTYVYGTDSQWYVDGGGNNNNNQSGGIYGGSGSLPDNVGVKFGQVTNNVDDKSNEFFYFADSPSQGDESYIHNYFYRNSPGENFDSMSYLIDHKLKPFGQPESQSGFIDFNSKDDYFPSHIGNLAIGGPNTSGVRSKKIMVGKNDHISFSPGQFGLPLTIAEINNKIYLGQNFNPNTDGAYSSGYQAYNPVVASSRIEFDTVTIFQSRVANTTTWNDLFSIDNLTNPSTITSPVKIRVDTSARDWDNSVNRNSVMRTIPQFVRDTEHRFTKLQSWNQGGYTDIVDNNELILDDSGNSYEFTFTSTTLFLKNFVVKRSNLSISEFPDGAIITIKFFNKEITPGYLLLINSDESNGSVIRSQINDANFKTVPNIDPPSELRLTIAHNPQNINNGDIITFRKYDGYWEVINVMREGVVTERNWETEGALNSSTSPWSFTNVSYLSSFASNYQFNTLNGVSILDLSGIPSLGTNRPYNAFAFPNGFYRQDYNPAGFTFRISVDGNRIVFVQGNFRISFGSSGLTPNTNLWYDRNNVWRIGKINSLSLIPQWETTWTNVSGYAYVVGSNTEIPVKDAVLSIDRVGNIYYTFKASVPSGYSTTAFLNPIFDVWVPPFSYIAATFASAK